jgi:hypothetical protein
MNLIYVKYPSPDRSENPFYFSFKNKKITTDSWTRVKRTGEANSSKKIAQK